EEKPAEPVAGGGTNRPDPTQITGDPTKGSMTVRAPGQGGGMKIGMSPDGSTIHMEAEKLTLEQLADSLTQFVGRPVVDQTGIKGNYKVTLDMSREDLMSMARQIGLNVPGG